MSTSVKQQYTPAQDELKDAIASMLDEAGNEAPSAKDAQTMLLKENPKWKLPERRVAKYLKKQLKARNNPAASNIAVDEDETSAVSSASTSSRSSRMLRSLGTSFRKSTKNEKKKSFFNRRKSASSEKSNVSELVIETAPSASKTTNLLPVLDNENDDKLEEDNDLLTSPKNADQGTAKSDVSAEASFEIEENVETKTSPGTEDMKADGNDPQIAKKDIVSPESTPQAKPSDVYNDDDNDGITQIPCGGSCIIL